MHNGHVPHIPSGVRCPWTADELERISADTPSDLEAAMKGVARDLFKGELALLSVDCTLESVSRYTQFSLCDGVCAIVPTGVDSTATALEIASLLARYWDAVATRLQYQPTPRTRALVPVT